MASFNERDTVGSFVKVKLVNNVEVEGTVFTYNPKHGLLVLMQDCNETNPSFRAIRTPFIKDFTVQPSPPEVLQLPEQLDFSCRLPSMLAGNGKSLFKYSSNQLRDAREKRRVQLENIDDEVPIAAVDTHMKISRVFHGSSWCAEEQVIQVTNEVVIIGDPDWNSPKAVPIDGVDERQGKSQCERFQKILEKK